MYVHARTHTYIHTHTHKQTNKHMHAYTHIRTHTHIYQYNMESSQQDRYNYIAHLFQVFDTPSLESKPFEERVKAIKDYFEEKK